MAEVLRASADPVTLIVKAANQTLGDDTTLQDDDDFSFAVPASSTWFVQMQVFLQSPAAGDFKHGWTVPAGTTMRWGAVDAVQGAFDESEVLVRTTDGNNQTFSIGAYILVDTTSGTIQWQWAKNATDATTTTVFAGSWLEARQIP